ncbi:MAG: hypothetical protein M1831_002775 [Alyxoria varia]|nr:MAG: hypothetical protein M1831_002775 [Alyxoria varia]
MVACYPIYLRRSDGKREVPISSTSKELNEPKPYQLDATPNTKGFVDCYRLCKPENVKSIDWRRKLGAMLAREVGNGTDIRTKNYILAAFPENYQLWEHVKYKAPGASSTEPKNSAGQNERMDAYLYGHPQGRKKRFRSPAEFFPHLLWLVTDETGDPGNCSCKVCTPEELSTEKPGTTGAGKDTKPVAASQAPQKPLPKAPPPPVNPIRRPSQLLNQPAPQLPSPLPRFKSLEQKLDLHHERFQHRGGEIVWFFKKPAWGLGVVTNREFKDFKYRIQPLSYPGHNPQAAVCTHQQLRPWLAWSPPDFTSAVLNHAFTTGQNPPTFDSVDWTRYREGGYGSGDPEIDGSILAVKSVESTFTPFDMTASDRQGVHFNGIYIGAEKVWVGDPLRLRNSQYSTDLMVLHDIVQEVNPKDLQKPRMMLMGETYSLRPTQMEPHLVPEDDLHLPSRVREDLNTRNEFSQKIPPVGKRWKSFWRLQRKNAVVDIAGIKGRWWETSIMMKVLDERQWNQAMVTGDLTDAGLYMNGQGDCNGNKSADRKVKTREEAFGRSVPTGFKVSRGLDEPKQQQQQLGQGQGQQLAMGGAQGQAKASQAQSQSVTAAKREGPTPSASSGPTLGAPRPASGNTGGNPSQPPASSSGSSHPSYNLANRSQQQQQQQSAQPQRQQPSQYQNQAQNTTFYNPNASPFPTTSPYANPGSFQPATSSDAGPAPFNPNQFVQGNQMNMDMSGFGQEYGSQQMNQGGGF